MLCCAAATRTSVGARATTLDLVAGQPSSSTFRCSTMAKLPPCAVLPCVAAPTSATAVREKVEGRGYGTRRPGPA
uniref:Uncharacterized protein n=1 Tax=Arundo donax TaxID=35708 RepID=A0A0A9QVT5_ARUDO